MTTDIVLTTFDWVPPPPRGHVRDLRIRWALEEAGLPYRVATVPFRERTSEHLVHQPFGQVPWLTVGTVELCESGAILLHLGEQSSRLLPVCSADRAHAVQWLFAALNSVEMATQPWAMSRLLGDVDDSPRAKRGAAFLADRLGHMDRVLGGREWLAGSFSVADIAMADVLRLVDRFDGLAAYPAAHAYVQRATARPAFGKALADQLALFAAAV